MPEFQYIARELSGSQVTGVLSAATEQDALRSLSARDLFPVQIDLAEEAKAQQRRAGGRVRPRHVSVFYTQLADLLRSGVPLLRSLELLERQTSRPTLKLVIQNVREQVADGTRLAEAMRQHPRVFGELAVSMVRAGEEGSFLEDVLKRIAAFTDHQEDLKSRVVGAMVYPLFLLVVGTAVVGFMLAFFVPKFAPIFERLEEKDQLPWATTTLMSLANSVEGYGAVLLILLAAAAIAAVRYAQTEEGRLRFDRFRLHAYGAGSIVRGLAIARFCRILGTLLRNGVPILQSLRIAKDAAGNRVLTLAIAAAAENISAGKSLAQPLSDCGQFPEDVVEMIAVGEEANNLEQVLIDIAENMECRANRQLELSVRLLEPILLLILAAIILFIVAALLVPILQMSSAL